MNAIEELMNEHEGIKVMLGILQAVTQKMATGGHVPAADLDGIMGFLTIFVDTCHHGKEEEFLFPAMEAAGVARNGGPIGVMLLEHERGRTCVARIRQGLADFAVKGLQAIPALQSAVNDYVSLLSQHIFKENNVLFPMAEKALSAAIDADLSGKFEKLERERIGAGKHEEFHALMDRLSAEHTPSAVS